MHVLLIPSFYTSPQHPYCGIFFRDQAVALQRAGIQTGVIAPIQRSLLHVRLGQAWGTQHEDDDGVPVTRHYAPFWFPLMHRPNAKAWIRLGLRLYGRYVATHGKPDVIHAHCCLYAGELARQIHARFDVPYVLTEHQSLHALGPVRPWQRDMTVATLQSAAARVYVSAALEQVMQSKYGVAASPSTVVGNPVDPLFGGSSPVPRGKRDTFRFVHVGNLVPIKRHCDLIKAFSIAFEDEADVELRLIGSGPLRQSIESQSNRVDLVGTLNRAGVLQELQNADALVLSSEFETFGVALIESLACGRPVIATRCGGPESIVQETDGLLVEKRNPQELANAMRKLRETIDAYDPEQMRADSLRRFGEQKIVADLASLYDSIDR